MKSHVKAFLNGKFTVKIGVSTIIESCDEDEKKTNPKYD